MKDAAENLKKKKKKGGAVNLEAKMKNSGVFMEKYRGMKKREKYFGDLE